MHRSRSSFLRSGLIAAAGLLAGGCGTFHLVRTTDAPQQDLFEDVMVTGSHIVYRVPTDKSIIPIHQPPKIDPLNTATAELVDAGPR